MDETHFHDTALVRGKSPDEPEYIGELFGAAGIDRVRHDMDLLARKALYTAGDDVRSDPVQPRHERRTSPLETVQAYQRLVEHFRRQVLRLGPVAHTPSDIRVHPVEMAFIQIAEFRRVALRGFDQRVFVGFAAQFP